MSLSRFFAISSLALVAVAGCAAKTTSSSPAGSDASLGTSEDALSTDDSDSQQAEDGVEDGVENGLSGATASDPGTPADGDAAAIDAKVKTNPGLYFKPAGCLVSTRIAAGQWSHVFTNCTGPQGKVSYNGTVTSKWTVGTGSIQVVHEATGFVVTGPNVSVTLGGSRTVTYSRTGSVISKHRVGSWTGTLTKNADASKSVPWSHQADFTSTWDASSKCFTRDGSAENSIGGREFGRKVTGYKACGGIFACPSSGELELDRKDGTVKITVTFLGGQDIEITGPKGNSVNRKIACIVQ